MRGIRRTLFAAGLLAAMLWPGQAQAVLASQCGAYHSGTTSCMFFAAGPSFFVYGSTSGGALEVRITDPTGSVRILICQGQSSCSASQGLPQLTDNVGPPQGVGPLLCTIVTSGSGNYVCGSYT